MLLYVNGDEISGGACAINDFVQASDDIHHTVSGDKAHPENIMHSYGYYLSRLLNVGLRCEATVKSNNSEIFNQTRQFVTSKLSALKSNYTVICVGLMPGVNIDELNDFANFLDQHRLEKIIFNTKTPLLKSANLTFGNYLDLKDENDCFITWCKNNKQAIKNKKYPDSQSHNAWAKHIFTKMIEVL